MTEQLTLYTAKICPFAHRVELALAEAKGDFTRVEIDLKNKPEWYAPNVNPASKVPAVTYGGAKAPPEDPAPDSAKIAESLVLLEFVADLYPNSSLLPKDPVLRAKARFFIDAISNKVLPALWGEDTQAVLDGLATLQSLLPPTGFAVSEEFTIADAAILPFLARFEVTIANDLRKFKAGQGKQAYETIQNDPKFARFRKYFGDLKARDSFKKTFDEPYITKEFTARFQKEVQA